MGPTNPRMKPVKPKINAEVRVFIDFLRNPSELTCYYRYRLPYHSNHTMVKVN